MSELPESEGKNPFHRAVSLSDLMSFHDIDFVRCAYVTMLGRQPDPSGQAHHLQQIRAGTSKLEVLWQIRQSPEAKGHDPGIAGLDRALRRAAWQRRPLLGLMSRFLRSDADGNSRSDRMLRSLLNASSINARHLHLIGERLSAYVAPNQFTAFQAQQSTKAGTPEAQPHPSNARISATGVSADETPELDHLRIGRVNARYVGHGAP